MVTSNRLAICAVALLIPAAASAARKTTDLPDWVREDHLAQVQRINRQLAVSKEDTRTRDYYHSAVVPTAYNRAALVLPEDTDVAQILFRRTRALLDELRTLSPAVSDRFEPAMAALEKRLGAEPPHVFPYTTRERERRPPPPKPVAVAGKKAKEVVDDIFQSDRVQDLAGERGTLDLNLLAMAPVDSQRTAGVQKSAISGVTAKHGEPTLDVFYEEALPTIVADRVEPVAEPDHPRIALAMDILALQRRIALANPLLGDEDLLLCFRSLGEQHIAAQYKRTVGNELSGLYRLSGYRSDAPAVTELLQGATVASGRLAGQPLDPASRAAAKLDPGAFGWPDLRWDGRQIVFSWKEYADCNHGAEDTIGYYNGTIGSQYSKERCFHVYSYDLDSKAPDRLRMLTDGSGNDGHPVYLPNGRIVFVSDRRGGVERCGGPSRATLLHSMNPDGSDQVNLSSHETSEFSPGVNNDGRLVYGRWDYVDRGDCIAHHIWTSYPDGRDPRAPHGNYFMGKFRPDAETEFQPIPGDHRLIALAAAHHILGHRGSVIVLDLNVADDDGMSQVRRFTPDIPFPETREMDLGQRAGPIACPWPLSRNFMLAGSDAGPVLLDAFGNRTLLLKPEKPFPTYEVVPLRPRVKPPVIPHLAATGTPPGQKPSTEKAPSTGTFTLINVYDSLLSWPEGTEIAALRIVRIYPRANTVWMTLPDVGVASESLVRGIVGTVPVESDGSASFEIPANTLVYFQALDSKGRAVQTMRSGTYLQPGARVTCQGCHEPKSRAPSPPRSIPLALRRPASVPASGPAGSDPVFYPTLVQPVLDKHCVSCHVREAKAGKKAPDLSPTPTGNANLLATSRGFPTKWTVSYRSLAAYTGRNFGGRPVKYEGRTTPGSFGTLNSKLYPLLAGGHHDVKLSDDEMMRLTAWMDLNSNFLGHYLFTEEQSCGILPVHPPATYPDTSDHPEVRVALVEKKEEAATETKTPSKPGVPSPVAPPKRRGDTPDLDSSSNVDLIIL